MGRFTDNEGMAAELSSKDEREEAIKFLFENDYMSEDDYDFLMWSSGFGFYFNESAQEWFAAVGRSEIHHLEFSEIKNRICN